MKAMNIGRVKFLTPTSNADRRELTAMMDSGKAETIGGFSELRKRIVKAPSRAPRKLRDA
ncbi:MAG: hypothetical protein KGL39_30545 [Patescibacteria group bacterium]|nr:hypothetical protein [Patescibacteria group bacterium]